MYVVTITASKVGKKPNTFDPDKLPADNLEQDEKDRILKSLQGAVPGLQAELEQSNDSTLTLRGDAPAPHRDAVLTAADELFRQVKGDGKGPILTMAGYVTDGSGTVQIGTPAT